jgi:hypothetical protein
MTDIGKGVARRLGTVVAAFLVGKLGIPEDLAQQLVMAGGIMLGLALDAAVAMYFARAR